MVELRFSSLDLELIRAALDSHIYWQLSDEQYRSDGHVLDPGSDDGEIAEQIAATQLLIRRLDSMASFHRGDSALGSTS